MESLNMSQNAEQAATDSVPPEGQSGVKQPCVKRQVSADAFRALTMRLNKRVASQSASAPLPEILAEPAAPVASEPALPAATEPEDPIVEAPLVDLKLDEAETVDAVPIATEAPLEVVPGLPTGGTKIILNGSIKSAFLPESPAETELPKAELPPLVEAIQADGELETALEETGQAQPVLSEQPVDPLLAAMNIVNAYRETADSPKAVEYEELAIPEIEVSLTETAEIALPQTPELEKLEPSPEVETVADQDIPAVVDEGVSENSSESPNEIASEIASENTTVDAIEKDAEEDAEDATVKSAKEQPVAAASPEQEAAEEKPDQADYIEITGKTLEEVEPAPAQTPANNLPPVVVSAAKPLLNIEPDAQSGETAKALLDMMSSVSGGSQPQERALAADTLLQLVPRMMVKDLVALSERVCLMENPPSLLISALINYPEPRVAGPLLQDGMAVSEQELLALIANTDKEQLIMVAKRRSISSSVSDALISCGDPSVYLTLVRNPGASLSHDSFVALCQIAKTQFSLQAPLATRGDTPPPIAFELFWSLPVELRRYILSRFLTDSATLDKILKLTQSVDGGSADGQKFPPQRKVSELVDLIAEGVTDKAAEMMAELAGCNQENASRIIMDPDGEPLTVVFKAMGVTRAFFAEIMKRCANSPKSMLNSERNLSELQVMFEQLSFNKARTLLTYWDWAIEKTGPYTRHAM